jgi:hypothetical protein
MALFAFRQRADKEFIFELTDAQKITQARAILSGDETYNTHIRGGFVKGKKACNPEFDLHLDPSSITFVDSDWSESNTTNMDYVNDFVEEAAAGLLFPGRVWVPEGAKLSRELLAK